MAFRSRNYLSTDLQTVEPIVKLWILRLLVPLECHRRFIGKCGVESEELCDLGAAALRRFDLKVKFDVLKPAQAWKLLQSYCQTFGLPVPDEHAQNHLQRLDGLTPGDFAVLARQHRFRPFKEVTQLVMALEAECALKTPHRRQPIGFV